MNRDVFTTDEIAFELESIQVFGGVRDASRDMTKALDALLELFRRGAESDWLDDQCRTVYRDHRQAFVSLREMVAGMEQMAIFMAQPVEAAQAAAIHVRADEPRH